MNALRLATLLSVFTVVNVFAQQTDTASATNIPNNDVITAPSPHATTTSVTPSKAVTSSATNHSTASQFVPPLIGGFCTLCGVIIGFALNAWRDYWKEKKRIQKTLNQIREELRANLQMLPWKCKTLREIVDNLKAGKALPGEGVRFIRNFYAEHFAAMCPYLSEMERNSIHVIYEHLRVVDETISSYDSELSSLIPTAAGSASGQPMLASFSHTYRPKMEDLLKALSVTENLIRKHLDGKPEDVFRTPIT